MFQGKVVAVTGGANGIGKCIAEEFRKNGAAVCVIDKQAGNHFLGDLPRKDVLEAFAAEVIGKYGHIDILVNNALPLMKGIDACTYEEFQYALAVGVTAPFYLSKLLLPYFAEPCEAARKHQAHIGRVGGHKIDEILKRKLLKL